MAFGLGWDGPQTMYQHNMDATTKLTLLLVLDLQVRHVVTKQNRRIAIVLEPARNSISRVVPRRGGSDNVSKTLEWTKPRTSTATRRHCETKTRTIILERHCHFVVVCLLPAACCLLLVVYLSLPCLALGRLRSDKLSGQGHRIQGKTEVIISMLRNGSALLFGREGGMHPMPTMPTIATIASRLRLGQRTTYSHFLVGYVCSPFRLETDNT